MSESRKAGIVVFTIVAVLVAAFVGWKSFGGSKPSPEAARNTSAGPINYRSSILGPDESGKPKTTGSPSSPGPSGQPGGISPMDRMNGMGAPKK